MSAVSVKKKKNTPVTLSVCLIVKNEERVLGRCLSAAIQFADELIVVDTGSEDRSREIAKEYTNFVFSEPWQNNFAKARNFAASKADGDYVMWLDADDVIYPDEIKKLTKLKIRLTNDIDVIFTTYRNHGFLSDMGLRDRIHRRELACRWEGDVHEAIPISKNMNIMLCPEITIVHKKEHVNEPGRNIRILKDIKNAGKLSGAYMLAYYCRELALLNNMDEGLNTWQELLNVNPPPGQVQYALVFMTGMLLRKRKYEKCQEMIRTSVEQYGVPRSAFLCYLLGLCAEGTGDIDEAERQYRLATDTPVNIETFMIEFAGYDDYLPSLKLCALAYDRKDMGESEAWNNRAGKAWPEGRAWRINRERFFTPVLPKGRNPLVSVIMPVCNGQDHIFEAVSSILDQSWRNFEFIIVDDASTDAMSEAIGSFSDQRIRILRNDHKLGIAASVNLAISVSEGEYIAFMGASDISLPDRLKAQMTFMESNREIMALGTTSLPIDREGKIMGRAAVIPASPKHHLAKMLIGKPEFSNSSVMIRQTFLKNNDLYFKDNYPGFQDYRFLMEASKVGLVSCLADTHYKYRVHDDRVSSGLTGQPPEERVQSYNRIRCDSLRMSGAELNEREEAALNRLLPEEGLPLWNRSEREELTRLFAKIRKQLKDKGFTAINELDKILLAILFH
jgi:glycosyltransferase involved in cell wall biosynthesis